MNWSRLALSAVLPFLAALPVAFLFWRRQQWTIGTAVGAGVVMVGTVLFMALEYGQAVQHRLRCSELNLPCLPSDPSDFVRIFSYALVGMADVMVLYLVSASAEDRMQRRLRAPEWR